MQFFFSIIIPVYNSEDYLPRCLDSILKQKFCIDKVQVIVVNDGSPRTKECDEIINTYKNKLNIDYLKFEQNKGLFLARKIGIEKSTGIYFLHLDSDDYLEKKALKTLHEDIQKNGDADYIEFNVMQLRRGRFKLKYTFLLPRDANVNVIDTTYNDGGHQARIFNKCFKASFAKPIYEKMCEDYIFFTEDLYQTCILDYFAKNRRILKKYLYVYSIGTGITQEQIYTKEKLKKIILSRSNIDKHLGSFYKKEGQERYIKQLKQNSLELYLWFFERSVREDFIECCKEILGDSALEKILAEHSKLDEKGYKDVKKPNKICSIFIKLKRYLKRRFRRYI